jgi:hypothetical protein
MNLIYLLCILDYEWDVDFHPFVDKVAALIYLRLTAPLLVDTRRTPG